MSIVTCRNNLHPRWQADALIEQLRPILEQIQAEENALHREAIKSGNNSLDVRGRLSSSRNTRRDDASIRNGPIPLRSRYQSVGAVPMSEPHP